MTITFTALESTHETAAGTHRRRMASIGIGFGLDIEEGGAVGVHARALGSAGVGYSSAIDVDPEIPAVGVSGFVRTTSGSGAFSAIFSEGDHPRRLVSHGFAAADHGATSDASGIHRRQHASGGRHDEAGGGYGLLVAMDFNVSGFGSLYFENLIESIGASTVQQNVPIYGVIERMRSGASPNTGLVALSRAADRMEFGDVLSVVLRELLAEGFAFDGDVSANYRAVERLVDALVLSGVAGSATQAVNILTTTIAFGDLLKSGFLMTATDSITINETMANSLRAAVRLIDGLLMEAAAEAPTVFVAIINDSLELAGGVASSAQLVSLIREGLSFALHLNIDDGRYVAYSINTESKAITRYNYPFNSFARLGGRYFGMTPDGIRELEGPDDAGSPIAARFRLAMSNLGTDQLKRMVAAYLGYTSTGELRIKTITVDRDGVKQAHHYRLLAQPATEPRQARVLIGQGLRSVYWGFEVEAIDGAAFHIDLMDLQPIAVGQRIQGQGGGKR
jgi:hypothetical protein